MTIAQLYQHLRTTDFSRLRAAGKTDAVMQQNVVRVASRAEADEYVFCMNYVPETILSQATHCWALELSYCGRMPVGHPAAHYIATELLNGYTRHSRKDQIKTALQVLQQHFDNSLGRSLRDTIVHLCRHLMQVQEERNEERQREQSEAHRQMLINAAENDPREQARDREIVAEEERRHDAAQQRLIDNARNRMQSAYTDDQAAIARAIALSLNTPTEAPPAPQVKIPIKEVVAFCNANELFRNKSYDPLAKKWKTTFIDQHKAKKIQEILEAETTEGQTECNVCMIAEGILSCGVGSCAGRMCGDCFFTWHIKNDKCPCCRAKFIPVVLRPKSTSTMAITAVVMQEETSGNDDE